LRLRVFPTAAEPPKSFDCSISFTWGRPNYGFLFSVPFVVRGGGRPMGKEWLTFGE
jgi:hypothetical protein